MIDGGFRLFLFAASGLLLNPHTQMMILAGLIPMVGGLFVGNRVHLRISREMMLRMIGVILVIGGMSLIGKVVL